ncbi:hypothetical protein ACLB1S_20880 [Escherichia coli]
MPTTIWDASVLKLCWLPGYEISAIFTHTDNPGEKAFYGSVARLAAERGIPVMRRMTLIIRCGWNALPNCRQM